MQLITQAMFLQVLINMNNINIIINQKVIFFYLLIFSFAGFSQSKLIDEETNKPLSDILIYNTKNEIIDITNKNGIFKVKNKTIKIINIIYGDTIIKNKKKILLKKKIYILPTTEINDSLPIMLRFKNSLINSKNLLPKDTVLFYKFEIKTEIEQINWKENVSGIYRVNINNKDCNIYICDNYKYHKDSIDFRISRKIPFFKVKNMLFSDYQKKSIKVYKYLEKKLKKELFQLESKSNNDTFYIKLYNSQTSIEYTFNKYIFSQTNNYMLKKLLYLQDGFINSNSSYLLSNNKYYLNKKKYYCNFNLKNDNKTYNVKYFLNIKKIDNYNCNKYYEFNDNLSNELIFNHLKSP